MTSKILFDCQHFNKSTAGPFPPAMGAGLDLRPLVTAEIQGHLDDFALDAEFGIRRHSGGRKVKLALAGAHLSF